MYLDELFTFEADDVPMDEAQTVDLGSTEGDRATYFPREVVLICKESPTIGLCTVSFGTNSPNYNNIVPATLITALNAANKSLSLSPGSLVNAVPGGTTIKCKVSIPASSGGTMRVVLIGLYGDYVL